MADFLLRPWHRRDASSLYRYAHNRKIADMLKDDFPYPYTYEDAKAFVSQCMQAEGKDRHYLAIDVGAKAVGSIGVKVGKDIYKKSAQIGFWLGEEFWGQEIMTGAIKTICEQAFEMFDIARIEGRVFANNPGARRALEKAGFTLEGVLRKSVYKNGYLFDCLLLARLKDGE